MKPSNSRIALAFALILVLALPAAAVTFRDRLVMSGVSLDGTIVAATVVDDGLGDFVSVSTSRSEACADANGNPNTIVTLANISIPDATVDVPELLRGVRASGTGTMFVTVIDRCAPSQVTTSVPGVSVSITGTRTSTVENVGSPLFRASGIGTVTFDGVDFDVTIDFQRAPL